MQAVRLKPVLPLVRRLALALLAAAPLRAAASPDLPPAPLAAPLPNDLLGATIHRLSNGLTVYLSENHEEPRVAAWIAVRTGGKHDPDDCTGLAHYLEHMLFKGTEKLGTSDWEREKPHVDRITALYEERFAAKEAAKRAALDREIDAANVAAAAYGIPNELDKAYRRMGFKGVNAFTSEEATVYVCDFPRNRADAWARLEADRFRNAVFRLFPTELETVYEEKNRSQDDAESILHEALSRKLYKAHPYGQHTVLGSIAHLKNPSLARMYAYFRARYTPATMAVVLAGDFDRAAMLRLVQEHFGTWPAAEPPAEPRWPLPGPKGTERVEVAYEAEEKVIIAWPLVARGHPDEAALTVMDMVMDNSAAGIINLDLNQAQKVKQAGSWPDFNNDAGAWHLWAVPKQGQSLASAERLLLGTVTTLQQGAFSEADLKAIVTNFEIEEKRHLESNEGRVRKMTDAFIAREPWPEAVARLGRLRAVTKADVVRVARRYLTENRVIARRRNAKPKLPSIAKPAFTKVPLDPSRQSAFFTEIISEPVPPILPKWLEAGRDYTVTDHPWGRLYAARNPFNDLFEFTIRIRRGSDDERLLPQASGLLALAGAGDLTAEAFKKRCYALGTFIAFGTEERSSWLTVGGLDANLEESVRLLFEHLRRPHLAADALPKMIQVHLGARQDNKRNPDHVMRALGEFAQRGPDSAVLKELSDAEYHALDAGRLTALAASLLDWKRDVRYVGNRPPAEIARLLDDGGGRNAPPPPNPETYLRPAAPRVLFTHRDMVQAAVGMFAADEVLDNARRVPYRFLSSYLGGGMSSVVFQEVREARALAYDAWGGYLPGAWRGDENRLLGELGTQADKTVEATALLRDLLLDPPLSATRFGETAQSILEGYRTNRIGFREVPGAVLGWEDQGIAGGDPRPRNYALARRFALDDLAAFAKRFHGRPLTIWILGHRDRVDLAQLKALGEFQELPLSAVFPY